MLSIAHTVASTSRKGGGLSGALSNLCRHLHRYACVTVLSVRDEFSEADRRAWMPLRPIVCDSGTPRSFGYSPDFARQVRQVSADIIHSHGLWLYPSVISGVIARRKGVHLTVSPHGMLDVWALKNSAWKKALVGWLWERSNLHSAACIHALCESEYQSIRAFGLRNPVCVIPNGVAPPEAVPRQTTAPRAATPGRGKKVILFLGRIHPKKGLENLIKAWGILKARNVAECREWRVVISGWSERDHESYLRRLAAALHVQADIAFPGPLYGETKRSALQNAAAFILPSFSEGLPVAILEAWAHGLPVIMTRECNLPRGCAVGAALETSTAPEAIAASIEQLCRLSHEERKAMGERGRNLVASQFAWPNIAGEMYSVYAWILGQGPKPACVRVD